MWPGVANLKGLWFSYSDTFSKFPTCAIALHLELEKRMCRWHFLACSLPASGTSASARAIFSYVSTPVRPPARMHAIPQVARCRCTSEAYRHTTTVWLLLLYKLLTAARAQAACLHNENALDLKGHDLEKPSQVYGHQLVSGRTSS